MHEYSIVISLIDKCQEQVKAHKAKKVTKLVVKVGVLSGVEIELLQRAFDGFKEDSVCSDAKMQIYQQKVVVFCKECNKEHTLEKFEFICPTCKGYQLDILDGEDLFLMQLELE